MVQCNNLTTTLSLSCYSLSDPCPQLQPSPDLDLPHFVDIWRPICEGQNPSIASTSEPGSSSSANADSHDKGSSTGDGAAAASTTTESQSSDGAAASMPASTAAAAAGHATSSSTSSSTSTSTSTGVPSLQQQQPPPSQQQQQQLDPATLVRMAAVEKRLKQKAALAADHFNKDYKKGFQYLQVRGTGRVCWRFGNHCLCFAKWSFLCVGYLPEVWSRKAFEHEHLFGDLSSMCVSVSSICTAEGTCHARVTLVQSTSIFEFNFEMSNVSDLSCQANNLLPELRKPPPEATGDATTNDTAAAAAPGEQPASATTTPAASSSGSSGVDQDALATCIGHFLRVCPGLSKIIIGELLGEPDAFYLKVK